MRALIVVDVQRDFTEGGSLAVEGGARVAAEIERFIDDCDHLYHQIVATKDWHVVGTNNGGHFDEWPVHCIAESPGSEFKAPIGYDLFDRVFYKGMGKPAYSGFEGVAIDGTSLAEYLLARDIDSVDVCGLALDYCVRATAVDARFKAGLDTRVLLDLTASVASDTEALAIAEFANYNIAMLDSDKAF